MSPPSQCQGLLGLHGGGDAGIGYWRGRVHEGATIFPFLTFCFVLADCSGSAGGGGAGSGGGR